MRTENTPPPLRPNRGNTPPPLRPNRGGFPRVVLLCLAAAALPFLGLIVWHVSCRVSNASAVRRLETAARQRGEPLTVADLATNRPSVSDSENAATALMDLWAEEDPDLWRAFRSGQRPLPEPRRREYDPNLPILGAKARAVSKTEPLSAEARGAAETWRAERRAHAEAARAALARPHCRFPVDLEETFAAPLPYLSPLRAEASAFQLESLLALEEGNVDQAIASLFDAARAGNALKEEPLVICQLVRLACLTIALNGAERVLCRRELSPAQLGRTQALLEMLESRGAARRAFMGERVMALSVFHAPGKVLAAAGTEGAPPEGFDHQAQALRLGMGVMEAIGLAAADRRLMLEAFEPAITLADDDTPAAIQQTSQALDRAVEKARRFPPKMFTGLLLPALGKTRVKFAVLEARRRGGLAALAVERYRAAQHGALPATLSDLTPQFLGRVPNDPFDTQPLRFKALAKGYVIYSVGSDGNDNEGRERPPKGTGQDYDETFTVAR